MLNKLLLMKKIPNLIKWLRKKNLDILKKNGYNFYLITAFYNKNIHQMSQVLKFNFSLIYWYFLLANIAYTW